MAAQAKGLDYGEMAESILSLALERYRPASRRPRAVAPAASRVRPAKRSIKRKARSPTAGEGSAQRISHDDGGTAS
jgi:hypothetical protein